MNTQNNTRQARIDAAKLSRTEALQAHRAALADVREAKSAVNREAHRARPVAISASAASAVAGGKLTPGQSGKGMVTAEHGAKYVSLAAMVGQRVTVTREGDSYTASVPAPKSTARATLTAAVKRERIASKSLASARASVKRVSVKPARKPVARVAQPA